MREQLVPPRVEVEASPAVCAHHVPQLFRKSTTRRRSHTHTPPPVHHATSSLSTIRAGHVFTLL